MADDCWGSGGSVQRLQPDEWSTDKGYKAFHSRYYRYPGDSWACKKCGLLVADTELHDEFHADQLRRIV